MTTTGADKYSVLDANGAGTLLDDTALSIERRQLIELLLREEAQQAPTTIRPRAPGAAVPASFAQQRLWFLDQVISDQSVYSVPVAVHLRGRLDVARFERCLNEIVERHEILRTTFDFVDGQVVQVIAPSGHPSLDVISLEHLGPDAREATVQRLTHADARQPFDLQRGPLLRARLLRLAEDEHIFVCIHHHSITDGWSIGLLVQEITAIYTAHQLGLPPSLPELPIQYADYAIWQHEQLRGDAMQAQLAYWRQALDGVPTTLELPTDRRRPAVQTFAGALHNFALPLKLTAALKRLSQREGATLFMTLLAAFQVLLMRYSRQDDIVVGTPVAGRTSIEIEHLLGCFINTVALRTSLAGNPTFRELLSRTRKVALGAFAHQDLPFERLVEELQPRRDPSRNPLFQVMFVLQNAPMPALDLPGLTLAPLQIVNQSAALDLTLNLEERAGELHGWFEYNTDLFDAATIERMLGHYRVLLASVVAHPEQPVALLPILTPAERNQLLEGWNPAPRLRRSEACIAQLIEARVAERPDASAIGGEDALSYGELNARANQLAHHLRALGVGPETLVGICLPRSTELVIALLGVFKAGGAYLPLDASHPPERLAYLLGDAQAKVLITSQEQRIKNKEQKTDRTTDRKGVLHTPPVEDERAYGTAPPAEHTPPVEDERAYGTTPPADHGQPTVVEIDTDWPAIARQPETNPESGVTPDNLAYIIYTSGSTGRPKGVQIPQRALVDHNLALIDRYALQPGDRVLQFASISIDLTAEEVFPTLISGACLVPWRDPIVAAPTDLLAFADREGLSVLNLPTPYWHTLVAEMEHAEFIWPSSTRLVIVGSEKALPERLIAWQRLVGERACWLNAYGPSETTITATLYEPGLIEPRPGSAAVPIGRPIQNVQTYLLDPHMQPVPIGVPGEVYIGGPGLARGYLGRPDLTAERFVPNPFTENKEQRTKPVLSEVEGNKEQKIEDRGLKIEDSSLAAQGKLSSILHPLSSTRLYKTGDLACYLPDGTIEYLGRTDHQIKVRGFRIELGEIETLLAQHPSVREAAVLAREVTPGDTRLLAYIVPGQEQRTKNKEQESVVPGQEQRTKNKEQTGETPASQFSIQELRDYLRQHLPDYMIPAAFVPLEALPLTQNGKVDRRALPEPQLHLDLNPAYVAPRSAFERTIAEIWQEALRVERVGRDDNFFDLGGHSLLVVQIHSRLCKLLDLDLTIVELFEHPTIGALAKHISRRQRAARPAQPDTRQSQQLQEGKHRLMQRLQQRQRAERADRGGSS